jgi:hypothetical protein
MGRSMSSPSDTDWIDVGVRLLGVLLRGAAYVLFARLVDGYDCGPALVLGAIVGDCAATALSIPWRWSEGRGQVLGEAVLLAITMAWLQATVVWPVDLAQRAILGLCAFGVFAIRTAGTALSRVGAREHGFV